MKESGQKEERNAYGQLIPARKKMKNKRSPVYLNEIFDLAPFFQ